MANSLRILRLHSYPTIPTPSAFLQDFLHLGAMKDIQKKVNSILTDKLGIPESEITPDASFVKDLGIDSLDYAELVMEFEQAFDIKIPDDDAEKMQTISEAVQYISNKVKS